MAHKHPVSCQFCFLFWLINSDTQRRLTSLLLMNYYYIIIIIIMLSTNAILSQVQTVSTFVCLLPFFKINFSSFSTALFSSQETEQIPDQQCALAATQLVHREKGSPTSESLRDSLWVLLPFLARSL